MLENSSEIEIIHETEDQISPSTTTNCENHNEIFNSTKNTSKLFTTDTEDHANLLGDIDFSTVESAIDQENIFKALLQTTF